MPDSILAQTQDNYTQALTLGGSQQYREVLFFISAPYAAQYELAKEDYNGKVYWDTKEFPVYPGQGGYGSCYGIKFRSLVPGNSTLVLALAFYHDDPEPSGFQLSDNSLTPSGLVAGSPTKVNEGQVLGTHGTPTQLGSLTCVSVAVKALAGNVGNVYLGGSTVTVANGYVLAPDESISFDIANLNVVYFDVDDTNDGVSYLVTSA